MFGTYFLNTPILGIGDPELAKQILVKDFNHFVNRQGEAISSIFESKEGISKNQFIKANLFIQRCKFTA